MGKEEYSIKNTHVGHDIFDLSRMTSRVEFDDPNLAHGFVQVPSPIIKDRRLDPRDVLVYILLLSYAWQKDFAFPGQQTLADDGFCDIRTIRRSIQKLERVKLIKVERRGLTQSNIYHIRRLTDAYPMIVE